MFKFIQGLKYKKVLDQGTVIQHHLLINLILIKLLPAAATYSVQFLQFRTVSLISTELRISLILSCHLRTPGTETVDVPNNPITKRVYGICFDGKL